MDAYLLVSSPEHIRRKLKERDGGICALCGCDADSEYRRWKAVRKEVSRLTERLIARCDWNQEWNGREMVWRRDEPPTAQERQDFHDYMCEKYYPGKWTSGRRSGWDADHVVPVIEGGGECGLENYRTLCHPCHKDVTAELAARRAEERRHEKQKEPS